MALDIASKYPGKSNAATAAYPFGSARNITTLGDGTGTPLEEAWLNDLFGFQQALINGAGLTPSGTADTAQASQYLEAARIMLGAVAKSVAELEAITASVEGQRAFLSAGGRSGPFNATLTDISTQVAADPLQGVYVAFASDPTGASGGWVRADASICSAAWFISVEQFDLISTFDLDSQDYNSVTQGLQGFFSFLQDFYADGFLPYGVYGVNDTVATITKPIKVTGAGHRKSVIRATTDMTDGAAVIHINDCGFGGGVTAGGTSTSYANDESGVTLEDFAVEGDLLSPTINHGIRVSGRTDWMTWKNISVLYMTGYGVKLGDSDGVNNGYVRESEFYNLNIRRCGSETDSIPALWITSYGTGDGTNQLNFYGLKCVFPNWKGVVLENGLGVVNTRRVCFYSPQCHGNDSGVTPHDHTLFTISGDVRDTHIYNIKFNASGADGWSMELLEDSLGAKPSGGIVTGNITTGGKGINADSLGGFKFLFDILSVTGVGFKTGTGISSPINFDVCGNEDNITLDLEPTTKRWVSSYSTKSVDLPIRTEEISMGHASAIVPSIAYNAGDPNGVLNRNPGSVCLNRSAVSQFSCDMAYLRGTGGSTTWRGIQTCVGSTTANRPATPTLYQSYFDTTLGKPIWYNGTNWVDATGATV